MESKGVFFVQIFCVKCNRHASKDRVEFPFPAMITFHCSACKVTKRYCIVHEMELYEYKQYSLTYPHDRLAVGFTRRA